jgi:hypothetical protein
MAEKEKKENSHLDAVYSGHVKLEVALIRNTNATQATRCLRHVMSPFNVHANDVRVWRTKGAVRTLQY